MAKSRRWLVLALALSFITPACSSASRSLPAQTPQTSVNQQTTRASSTGSSTERPTANAKPTKDASDNSDRGPSRVSTAAASPAVTSSTARSSATPSSSPTTPPAGRSYINVDGVRVRSPVFTDTKPDGATARCRDGSFSFSQHRSGTCSHHGGVAEWF
jgi:hypothetical protein